MVIKQMRDWPWYGQAMAAFAFITGLCGAIVGISNAYGIAEPHWPATRHFVREEVHQARQSITTQVQIGDLKQAQRLESLERSLVEAALSQAINQRSTLRSKVSDYQATLQSKDLPPQAREIINNSLEVLLDDQRTNDIKIQEYRKKLSPQ